MGNQTYELFNLRKNELAKIAGAQLEIAKKVDDDSAKETSNVPAATPTEEVSGALERLNRPTFNVLLVGCFSSGKSTFLNALIGEKLLPQSSRPCTGVLTFLKYAPEAEKKILIYKKDVPAPEIIEGTDLKAELKKRVRISDDTQKEEATKATPYEKAEVFYPLDLCKNGVEIIDSVGLDDPESRDTITFNYATKADAIIYCVDSGHANSASDQRTIRELCKLGFEKIFCIVTFYDRLVESSKSDGEPLEEVKEGIVSSLLKLQGLSRGNIFFVDSKHALEKNADAMKLFSKMKTSLEQFLVNNKGKDQLVRTVEQLGKVNAECSDRIRVCMDLLSKDATEIVKKIEAAKIPLQNREEEARGIIEDLNGDIKDTIDDMRRRAEAAFDNLSETAQNTVQNYSSESSDQEDWKKELNDKLNLAVEERSEKERETLVAVYKERVDRLEARLKKKIDTFNKKLSELCKGIDLDYFKLSFKLSGVEENSGLGWAATAAVAVGSMVAFGLIALPFVFLGKCLFNSLTKDSRLQKFKEAALSNVRKAYSANKREKFVSSMVDSWKNQLEDSSKEVESCLKGEIEKIRTDLQKTLKTLRAGKTQKDAALNEYKENLAKNAELSESLSLFKSKIS